MYMEKKTRKTLRPINTKRVTKAVKKLFIEANTVLGEDVVDALNHALSREESATGKQVLEKIIENADIACRKKMPVCQDTGLAVFFVELGDNVTIEGGRLSEAINEGVRQAYEKGYLRKSMVLRPFSARVNTKDNTPAIIYTDIVPGDKLKIIVMPKGGGAENMSRLVMLTPAAGRQGIVDNVLKTVDEAGSNPCPPIIVGVGVGGTAEKIVRKRLAEIEGRSYE